MMVKMKEAAMPTLAAAVNNGHWDLAAHVLILAALQTLNDEGPVLSPSTRLRTGLSKGGNPGDGKKKRVRKRQTNHS